VIAFMGWLALRGLNVTEASHRWSLRAVVIGFGLVTMALQIAAHR
jgi:hypothetical protein